MLEPWITMNQYGDTISRDNVLAEIKTNLINVISDYAELGISDEIEMTAKAASLFTGEVVPSRKDWYVLIDLLKKLATVKEQGVMYDNFIQDVSDSLGISDLIKIKEFIDYIQTLAPKEASFNIILPPPAWYEVVNVKSVTTDYWKNGIVTWDLSNNYLEKPIAFIDLTQSDSEDIATYQLVVQAGNFYADVTMTPAEFKDYTLTLDWLNWFTPEQLSNASIKASLTVTDKRGNITYYQDEVSYTSSTIIPEGVSHYEVAYKYGISNWILVGKPTVKTLTHALAQTSGNFQWRVRAIDKSGLETAWVYSESVWIHFPAAVPAVDIQIGIDPPAWYQVINVDDTSYDDWETAHVTWDISNNYLDKAAAQIAFSIVGSEESVASYSVNISAGTYKTTYTATPGSLYDKKITLDWLNWFSPAQLSSAKLTATVTITGTRGGVYTYTASASYNSTTVIPQGVHHYEIGRQVDGGSWSVVGTPADKYFDYSLPQETATFRWRVRAIDKSGQITAWAYSAPTTLTFAVEVPIPDFEPEPEPPVVLPPEEPKPTVILPPDRPKPVVSTTEKQAIITWQPCARAKYYEVWHQGINNNIEAERTWCVTNDGKVLSDGRKANYFTTVNAGSTLKATHFDMNPGQEYNWNVRAINDGGQATGTARAKQKQIIRGTKSYTATGTNCWNGPYTFENYNHAYTTHQAGWRYANPAAINNVYHGFWKDPDWGVGGVREWFLRGGDTYWAWDGQTWGNNMSFIYLDYNKMRSELAGKTIKKVTFTFNRTTSIHGYSEAQPLYIYNHNRDTNNATSNLSLYNLDGSSVSYGSQHAVYYSAWDRGESDSFANADTKTLIQNIVDGSMKGIGLVKYYGTNFNTQPTYSDQAYMIFKGNVSIKVEYEQII